MSTDNILAVAGASAGSFFLLLFGLGLSIPIVVIGAAFIAILMERYGWIVYAGAGVLGEVAAKMMIDDEFVRGTFDEAPKPVEWALRIGLATFIIVIGLIRSRRSEPAKNSEMMRKG